MSTEFSRDLLLKEVETGMLSENDPLGFFNNMDAYLPEGYRTKFYEYILEQRHGGNAYNSEKINGFTGFGLIEEWRKAMEQAGYNAEQIISAREIAQRRDTDFEFNLEAREAYSRILTDIYVELRVAGFSYYDIVG